MINLGFRNGSLITQIVDAHGELFDYAVEVLPAGGPLAWTVKLTRLDSCETHVQELARDGSWTCSCRDFEFRFRRHRGDRPAGAPCKHISEFAVEFHRLTTGALLEGSHEAPRG